MTVVVEGTCEQTAYIVLYPRVALQDKHDIAVLSGYLMLGGHVAN